MSNNDLGSEIDASNENTGNNTGQTTAIAAATGTAAEWGDDEPYESLINNTKNLLTDTIAELKSRYPNKDINVNGIKITKVQL